MRSYHIALFMIFYIVVIAFVSYSIAFASLWSMLKGKSQKEMIAFSIVSGFISMSFVCIVDLEWPDWMRMGELMGDIKGLVVAWLITFFFIAIVSLTCMLGVSKLLRRRGA